MATAKLTDKTLKNLKPPKVGRLEVWDSIVGEDRTLPGVFGIRIQVMSVEVDTGIVDMLITKVRLSEQDTLDPKKIAGALLELAGERMVEPQPPKRPIAA